MNKNELWKTSEKYRKKVVRELESKLGLNISPKEFSRLVYGGKTNGAG